MSATSKVQTDIRFFLAFGLAGIVSVAVFVVSFLVGVRGGLDTILVLAVGFGTLLLLSRTPYFRDALSDVKAMPTLFVPVLAAGLVSWWVSSSTGLYARLSDVNQGAPPTIGLALELTSVGLLVISAMVAGIAVSNRQAIPIERLHIILAANTLMFCYAALATFFPSLHATTSVLVPLTAIALTAFGYVRWAILKHSPVGRSK